MSRDESLYFEDILKAAKKIQLYTAGIDYSTFIQDSMRIDAVVRNIEIIGEAAARLSPENRGLFSAVPWKEIIGMRNILIHAYFGIDYDIVWDVISTKIDNLVDEISRYYKFT